MEHSVGEPLLYGSMVLLTRRTHCLYSKGFIEDSIYLQDISGSSGPDVMGALYRVLPSSLFTTQDDLLEAIEAREDAREQIQRMEDTLEGEIKINVQNYRNFRGQPVHFGSLVQLEHIWTHKFLTVKPSQNAELEKDNIRLVLEDFISEGAHFRLNPCYKYQEEADGVVRIGDYVLFEASIPEMGRSVYIHSSDSLLMEDSVTNFLIHTVKEEQGPHEVNASLEQKTPWKVLLFSEEPSEDHLECGDYI